MTKPQKIAFGIGVAATAVAGVALVSHGVLRALALWTAIACVVACAAYVRNRPEWLGKRAGRLSPLAFPVLPYLVAFGIAVRIMRWWRPADRPTRVAPGLWVSGRVTPSTLPPPVVMIVDLVAEYGADPALRRLPGYRSLPILDGGVAPDLARFLDLVGEAAATAGDVLVHCDSGRGRAPTFAAAVLIARGDARDAERAVETLRTSRSVVAPTRSDMIFLARAVAALTAAAPRALPVDRGELVR